MRTPLLAFISLISAAASTQATRPPEKPDAICAREMSLGADSELEGTPLRSAKRIEADGGASSDQLYRTSRKQDRLILTLLSIADPLDGERRETRKQQVQRDGKYFASVLRRADPNSLSRFCQFSGGNAKYMSQNIEDFVGVRLALPTPSPARSVNYAQITLSEPPRQDTGDPFRIYATGDAYVCCDLLRQALRFPVKSKRLSLEAFYLRGLNKIRNSGDRARFAILIASLPSFHVQNERALRAAMIVDRSTIASFWSKIPKDTRIEFCRWSRTSLRAWQRNIEGLVAKPTGIDRKIHYP